ncbi:DUF4249 domain-containing protein [Puia dinghuensis]|uniref:DUF4249 domain-containing protein n=1 Tax=Puia dinghuensis TaxID=1792502 RepID=A0A8J2UL80_9BACT|nr:DUF4249 domain-containing protein [Puia dinghuensis]GGB26067.1 hypothetical protein GCM10011511_57530 [Puia dinghuensis]
MRPRLTHISLCLLALLIDAIRCRQAYAPPAVKAVNSYLVVDGFINTGANTITTFKLNRTNGLNDSTLSGIPERNARIFIVSSNGATYPLTDLTGAGTYTSAALNLDITQQYSLKITTADNRKYATDAVPCKQTPPIDSLYWRQPGDLTIYVNTHDPSGNTRYYRYDYIETWEHDAALSTSWTVVNGRVIDTDTNYHYRCWTTAPSTNVLLASSTALASDTIVGSPLATFSNGDTKLYIGYSILVRQYAQTEEAHNYWLLIQKTTQNTGTLFDLQPSQLIGNIHCLTDPSEPVIGFLSACSLQQRRLFISNASLQNWIRFPLPYSCPGTTRNLPVNPADPFSYNYPDTTYAPWYFVSAGPLVLAPRKCLDCTVSGGTSIKPSFW